MTLILECKLMYFKDIL
ncbi:unnamed protein product [Debaryomyces tyrocola]|nr:unnamed protein product [Debaryomyces tyrocola]